MLTFIIILIASVTSMVFMVLGLHFSKYRKIKPARCNQDSEAYREDSRYLQLCDTCKAGCNKILKITKKGGMP